MLAMCILLTMYKGITNCITLTNWHWKSFHYFSVNILSQKIVIDKSYVNMHWTQYILYTLCISTFSFSYTLL